MRNFYDDFTYVHVVYKLLYNIKNIQTDCLQSQILTTVRENNALLS
jgi:hypothetical protein